VKGTRIADRYAGALALAAQRNGVFDEVVLDMVLMEKVLIEGEEAFARLSAPEFSPQQRMTIVEKSFYGRIHPLTLAFVKTVFRRQRQHILSAIPPAFAAEADRLRGIVRAHLSSVSEIDSQQRHLIIDKLERRTGKRVELTSDINPLLLAGFRVMVAGKLIDCSAAGALARLREYVLEKSRMELSEKSRVAEK
jgi:F-type H+-transporting ATPase subunit delta